MKYLCLIYSDETDTTVNPDPSTEAFQEMMAGYRNFGEQAGQAGVLAGGEALAPTMSATSVQLRDGDVITTDGPFAETKEQLGGFYLVECDTLDEAVSWASKIPHAATGTIEVRPVLEFD